MGNDRNKNPTFLGIGLSNEERKELVELLKDYKDCFAWSYEEMPGLAPEVALHRLAVQADAKAVQQAKRKYNPEIEK